MFYFHPAWFSSSCKHLISFYLILFHPLFFTVLLYLCGSVLLGSSHWVSLESAALAQASCSHMTFVYSPTLLIAHCCTEIERRGWCSRVVLTWWSEMKNKTEETKDICLREALILCFLWSAAVNPIDFALMMNDACWLENKRLVMF